MKEKIAQMYSILIYLLSKFTADLPANTLVAIISGTLIYVRALFSCHPIEILCSFVIIVCICLTFLDYSFFSG
jgi:hypothetical protein